MLKTALSLSHMYEICFIVIQFVVTSCIIVLLISVLLNFQLVVKFFFLISRLITVFRKHALYYVSVLKII